GGGGAQAGGRRHRRGVARARQEPARGLQVPAPRVAGRRAAQGGDRQDPEAGYRHPGRPGRPVRLLLLAPPGAGKGTQGERLAATYGVRHIAAGDLLRAEAQAGTPAGREIAAHQARGDLVPDPIVLTALPPAVVEAAAGGGYILDGFPRTLPQATAAAELAARLGVTLDAAVYLFAPEAVLPRRLLDRARQSGRADDTADV